jgi:pyruvate dehydrogenase E2 component (dihydrolipoamide acetyltransferase)
MPTNVIMPQMGESIAEGTITKWIKKVGEHVDRDEPLFEISTDKVDAEIPSPAAGVLTQILAKENETVAVKTVVAVIDGEGVTDATHEPKEAATSKPETAPPAAMSAPVPTAGPSAPSAAPFARPEGEEAEDIRTSPLVRRIAREHNVDLSQVKGTGMGGRVSKKDILEFIEQQSTGKAAPTAR